MPVSYGWIAYKLGGEVRWVLQVHWFGGMYKKVGEIRLRDVT